MFLMISNERIPVFFVSGQAEDQVLEDSQSKGYHPYDNERLPAVFPSFC